MIAAFLTKVTGLPPGLAARLASSMQGLFALLCGVVKVKLLSRNSRSCQFSFTLNERSLCLPSPNLIVN